MLRWPLVLTAGVCGLTVISGCTLTPTTVAQDANTAAPMSRADAWVPTAYTAPAPAANALLSPNGEAERAALSRLEHELSLLETFTQQAERARDTTAPIAFDYLSLRRDLELIRSGVRAHLLGPSRAPRALEPLRGDYR